MADQTDLKSTAAGIAALAICESLLLALGDLKLVGARDTAGVLEDAAAALRGTVAVSPVVELHLEAAAIIDRMIAGRSSIPHP